MDRFASFLDLSRVYAEDDDFRVHWRAGTSGLAIFAPHGGWIERGTGRIADAVAGNLHGYYCFEGLNRVRRRDLHITSNLFDEPQALALARQSNKIITVHGARGRYASVFGGGLDRVLRDHVLEGLAAAGFDAEIDPSPTRQGNGPCNICNRGRSRAGVQLELTVGLRKHLFRRDAGGTWRPAEPFHAFVDALRVALGTACPKTPSQGASRRLDHSPSAPRE